MAARTKKVEIRCVHCQGVFHSPLTMATDEQFYLMELRGTDTKCPHCQKETPCNDANMRIIFEGHEGFTGKDA